MTAPIPRDIPDLPALPRTAPQLLPSVVPARAVVPPVRRPLTAVYRLALAVLATAAALTEILLGSPTRVLSYFVIQSTALLALVTFASARRAWTARHPLPGAVTGAALLYVVVAALVHHITLADAAPAYAMAAGSGGGATWLEPVAGHLLHTVLPVAALLDWLVLTPPARMHLRHATTWLLYPLAYLAFALARGELLPGSTGRYLYPFLDVARHGYRSVLANALLVGLAIYAVAVLLVALDHTRPKTRFRL
ncbi:Pr6Pr family membrane protein [Streptomyces griseoincarnatus]|uniref:Pr6Pr family membrane protein n=1 Tax=Streptomyces tunisiensis TaxID=948699 RepID=A0ABP7XLZ8_9ACTN|nr:MULTISPECIES: Pr6Pr family membrane protein [unclassified Streptomyces]MBU5944960.1 Pr6Pr family membrane protein [Streptomyces sp. PAM3C]